MRFLVGLLAALSLLLPPPALAWGIRGEVGTTTTDGVNYTKAGSPFLAYAGDWCKDINPGFNLVRGVDYLDTITVRPSSFPHNTRITSSWPNSAPYQWIGSQGVPLTCGVWGMMAVSYGNYADSVPSVAITSRQVSNITTLTEEFNLSISGDVANFSVLDEFYLTATAGDTSYPNQRIEIGFFLHPGADTLTFVKGSTQIGTYTDPQGRQWRAAYSGAFHTFTLLNDGDLLVGKNDHLAAIQYLVAQGRVTTSWWFNGMGLGIEPTRNAGALQINRWTVVYN